MKTIRTHCNGCFGQRDHEVLHREIVERYEEFAPGDFEHRRDEYILVKCCGCQSVALLHDMTSMPFSEWAHNRYPPEETRQRPERIFSLPLERDVNSLLNGIYTALPSHLYRLVVMGIRSLLERIMIHKNGDCGTFRENLRSFLDMNFISKSDFDLLVKAFEVGHAATHRGYDPSREEALLLLDIAEHIMESVYANAERAERLNQHSLPPRQKAERTKGKLNPNDKT